MVIPDLVFSSLQFTSCFCAVMAGRFLGAMTECFLRSAREVADVGLAD